MTHYRIVSSQEALARDAGYSNAKEAAEVAGPFTGTVTECGPCRWCGDFDCAHTSCPARGSDGPCRPRLASKGCCNETP